MSQQSNKGKLGAMLFYAGIITAILFVVFHFWLFPTGIEILENVEWVSVTDTFTNALYWFSVGLMVFFFIKGIKIQL